MSRKDKYNGSGCLDMTAYLALRKIEREERLKKEKMKKAEKAKTKLAGGKHGNR